LPINQHNCDKFKQENIHTLLYIYIYIMGSRSILSSNDFLMKEPIFKSMHTLFI